MRRFSQRNSLVTLTDINITPLLDLAFVLLIIFVIATPLIEQGIELDLPQGGSNNETLKPDDLYTLEAGLNGEYLLNGKQLSFPEIENSLIQAFSTNKLAIVSIRMDRSTLIEDLYTILDRLQKNNILRIHLRTSLENSP